MKTRVPSMPSTDLRAVARIHYEEMAAYLMNHPAKEPANMRPPTQRELARLTTQQFQELSTDVYDELIRKNNNSENELPSLPVRGEFHPKRNEARQKLATHPRFKDFCNYVFEELRRRVPDLKEVGVRFPITTAHHISSIQNNRKIEDSVSNLHTGLG
ncbi:hypothetical protein BD410DRAFT_365996 [Rickenella mellea]|uniref:GIT Spa2 homology (SHD) domain-containing protein n=1 Tax=Rickenella mellea TaxID=50990 RepID=A0A4Y7PZR4_9AGAM|nr:hypothetical protein BD410DRAFT_365996 [Rickenella mellea]